MFLALPLKICLSLVQTSVSPMSKSDSSVFAGNQLRQEEIEQLQMLLQSTQVVGSTSFALEVIACIFGFLSSLSVPCNVSVICI